MSIWNSRKSAEGRGNDLVYALLVACGNRYVFVYRKCRQRIDAEWPDILDDIWRFNFSTFSPYLFWRPRDLEKKA